MPSLPSVHEALEIREGKSMTDNIVSLKAFRTLKECQKLFQGYRARLGKMDKTDLLLELERYRKEAANYPHHLLTVVKGEILMNALKTRSLTDDLKNFALTEERRLKVEVYRRLHEEWTGSTGNA
ncbi:MAG TPA: hypothetical protein VIH99_01600 [Bdellovibrionota bacterium]|jgi:hypothetical protein